ncbi:hypothetical protein EMMF5_005678 [Cystobasidiomycetes sp. EMM_F5]
MAYASPIQGQVGTVPPPSALGVSGVLPGQASINTTRILSFTGFSKDLKTRDIQSIFVDYEDDRGGYRIKWLDDTGCLMVFNDPITAKRAFLNLLANPHPHLQVSTASDGSIVEPKLAPYLGEDASQVVASVANRPRSRSISTNVQNGSPGGAASGQHSRRLSNSTGVSNIHSRMASSGSSGSIHAQSMGLNGSNGRGGFGRPSVSQGQMQSIMDEAVIAEEESSPPAATTNLNGTSSPPSPTAAANANANGGAIDWSAVQQQQAVNARTRGASPHFTSPPISPERGLGANSPTRLRRLMMPSR